MELTRLVFNILIAVFKYLVRNLFNMDLMESNHGIVEYIFDVDRCIGLHNKLIELACQARPELRAKVRRIVFSIAPDTIRFDDDTELSHEQIREFLGLELVRFLEDIDTFEWEGHNYAAINPLFRGPILGALWRFGDNLMYEESSAKSSVLLYQDANDSTSGGVFINPHDDNWAAFLDMIPGGDAAIAHRDKWVPLDEVLPRWVRMWEVGKFRAKTELESRENSFAVEPWVERDVEKAVQQWHRLLSLLESRNAGISNNDCPTTGSSNETFEPMVSDELLAKWNFPSFGREFFKRARKPRQGIQLIAPGITLFNDKLFEQVQNGPKTERLQGTDEDTLELARAARMLLFPAITQGMLFWDDYHQTPRTHLYYLQDQRGGIYPNQDDDIRDSGNGVQFINSLGQDHFFQRQQGHVSFLCPWASWKRGAVLSEVLESFTALIELGAWEVNSNGVVEGMDWWN